MLIKWPQIDLAPLGKPIALAGMVFHGGFPMMRIVQIGLVLASAFLLAACGDATGTGSEGFGIAAPATRTDHHDELHVWRSHLGREVRQRGRQSISIDQVEFLLTNGQTICEDFGFGVGAGETITDSFDTGGSRACRASPSASPARPEAGGARIDRHRRGPRGAVALKPGYHARMIRRALALTVAVLFLPITVHADGISWRELRILRWPRPARKASRRCSPVYPSEPGRHPLILLNHGSPRSADDRPDMTAAGMWPQAP